MSNVFKFDPNAIRERSRLSEKSPPMSAREGEEMRARKNSRRAWLLFVGAAILLTILKTVLHIGYPAHLPRQVFDTAKNFDEAVAMLRAAPSVLTVAVAGAIRNPYQISTG